MRRLAALYSASIAALLLPALAHTASGAAPAAAARVRASTSPPIRAIELAYEILSANLQIPDGAASFLLVTPCARCAPQSLAIDGHSQFILNGKSITLTELHHRLGAHADWQVTALYTPRELRLTRLLVKSRLLVNSR